MTATFARELGLHLESGYPIVFVLTQEEERTLPILSEVALAQQLALALPRESTGRRPLHERLADATAAGRTLVVLDDIHRRLEEPDILRLLADLCLLPAERHVHVVILAPFVELPPELERAAAVLELPLPTPPEIEAILDEVAVGTSVLLPTEESARIVRSAQGLTAAEARRAFSKALTGSPEDWDAAHASVVRDKKRALRRSRVLESVSLPLDLRNVGGLDQLKEWLATRAAAFSEEARNYGLPAPRGLLLMGVQGCGKSLTAKAVAGHWRLPLVRLDLSAVFGAARPEEALRTALRTVEAMAPIVLWIDELEKGFDQGGEGPAARLLGGMVTWLQEKQQEVFVVATANRVASLPPELPRKGRFDEIFFVDLPNVHERLEILQVHLARRGRVPESFDLEGLAKKAERFTGAELEQAIIAGMYTAFARGAELSNDDIVRALRETVPLYETYEPEIKALREWARTRARPASTDRRKVDLFVDKH